MITDGEVKLIHISSYVHIHLSNLFADSNGIYHAITLTLMEKTVSFFLCVNEKNCRYANSTAG